jgi:spermidine/putrescine transport system substrate-binding protein
MKKSVVYMLIIAAMLLAACGGGQATEAPAETQEPGATEAPTGGETTDRCGDREQLADEIFLYNWVEYIDPDIYTQFEEECGVTVTETNFDSNETLLATLQAGGADYDIVVPSDYMVQIMIDEGMLMELDWNVITNIQHMDPLNVNQYFDPEQRYVVPYFWGTSGGYRCRSLLEHDVRSELAALRTDEHARR